MENKLKPASIVLSRDSMLETQESEQGFEAPSTSIT